MNDTAIQGALQPHGGGADLRRDTVTWDRELTGFA